MASAAADAIQLTLSEIAAVIPSEVEGSRRESFKVTSSGSLD